MSVAISSRNPPGPLVRWIAALALFLAFASWTSPALAQAASSLKGVISARTAEKMTVKTPDGSEHVYTITPSTRAVQVYGRFNMQKKDMSVSDLIEGLAVNVEATATGTEMAATTVTFRDDDLKTARQIEAGTSEAKAKARAKAAELEAQNQALKNRLAEANEYVEKGQTAVRFATGSAALSEEGKASLQDIATRAKGVKGYWLGVSGHADTTGNAQANQALSEKRANAVIRYLQKCCAIQPHRVLAGVAVGDVKPVADESTAEGRAANRRVVVQILVNKGLEGL